MLPGADLELNGAQMFHHDFHNSTEAHSRGKDSRAIQLDLRLIWIVAGAIGGVVITVAAFLAWRGVHDGGAVRTLDAPAMVRQIQGLSELISVKYTVQKVVGLEEKKSPVGSEKILLIVQAEVLAGVDVASMQAGSIRVLPNQEVKVTLPPAKIFHVVIDDKETKVWDRQITWWTPWVSPNPDLERQARLAATKSVEDAAVEMGILDQARRNAETVIRNLLGAIGVKSVAIGT